MNSEPTIGMRLDAAIARLDNLSSTQLYALIVGLVIMASFLILGPAAEMPEGDPSSLLPPPPEYKAAATDLSNLAHAVKSHREPRWHIFRWVNYATVLTFGWSVVEFGMHCSDYLQDSDAMLKFLFAWSILVCYFFAFFGISFVHDTIEENNNEQQQQAVLQKGTDHDGGRR
jgi:quinol-cytochrome oxidoreductase complex cytochrome b subunit